MDRQNVISSNITSIGYDPRHEILEVEFDGGAVYQYYEVPPHVHEELMSASSHGIYLNAHIKGKYRYEKL